MDKQLEIKRECYLASLGAGIIPCYQFACGRVMEQSVYNAEPWLSNPYDKDAFYLAEFKGDNTIYDQTAIFDTEIEANNFLNVQRIKQVRDKLQDVLKLVNTYIGG